MSQFWFKNLPASGGAYDAHGRRKYLTAAEGKAFLRALSDVPKSEQSLGLVIYYTGCRLSEALNLTGGDFDQSSQSFRIRTLKKRDLLHYRRVPLPPRVARAIQSIQPATLEAPLWPISRTTAWRGIKRVMDQAGIKGPQATAKGLRHAFGVRAALARVPLHVIQQWMGHARITTTAIYIDVVNEEEKQLIRRTW